MELSQKQRNHGFTVPKEERVVEKSIKMRQQLSSGYQYSKPNYNSELVWDVRESVREEQGEEQRVEEPPQPDNRAQVTKGWGFYPSSSCVIN